MNQRGFATAVAIVVAVLVIGGVIVYGRFYNQKPSSNAVEVQYDDRSKFGILDSLSCIAPPGPQGREMVVNSQVEYQGLLIHKSTQGACADFVLPQIDFSQKTLLGNFTNGGRCSIEFNKKVYRDDSEQKVFYVIDVVERGNCKKAGSSQNWILVPKIPESYSVEFQVK